ncbi:MAG TPA: hypothetical protein V6C86_12690 [Oculatellaceae cyanobacterium]
MRPSLLTVIRELVAIFIPRRKAEIDWKHIGQLRTRLNNMRPIESPDLVIASTNGYRSMSGSFRSLSEKTSDRRGLSRWYSREDAEESHKELQERIAAGQRSIEELKNSGQFPAIREEDLAALREVHNRFITSGSVEDKLASFLSQESDDINSILYGDTATTMPRVQNSAEIAAPAAPMSANSKEESLALPELPEIISLLQNQERALDLNVEPSPDDTLKDLPAVTEEMLASLERAAQIDSVSSSQADNLSDTVAPRSKKRKNRNKRNSRQGKQTTRNRKEEEEAELAAATSARDHLVEALPPSNLAVFRQKSR